MNTTPHPALWGLMAGILSGSTAHGAEVCFEDVWGVEYAAGVEWCSEATTPPGSAAEIAVNSVHIDLTEPTLYVRVTREDEGGRTTSSVASLLGSTVSINGDFSDPSTGVPTGLSVGNGWHWTDTWDKDEDAGIGDWPVRLKRTAGSTL